MTPPDFSRKGGAVMGSSSGRCAFIVAGLLSFVVLIAAWAQEGDSGPETRRQGDEVASEVLGVLRQAPADRAGDLADRGRLLRAGFDAFIERMDAFDGDASVDLARELFREDPAIWSAYCLDGALRRSAPADARGSSAGYREALDVLERLRETYAGDPAAQLDVTQRIAILAAGFGVPAAEASALGRALAAGGVDGAQIAGMAALSPRPGSVTECLPGPDHAAAARLFGSLLDRAMIRPRGADAPGQKPGDNEPVIGLSPIEKAPTPIVQPEVAAWALRGHALASLELLRGHSSIQD